MLNSSRVLLLMLLLFTLMSGCGSTKTGLSAIAGHSGFDNARTVNIYPHANVSTGPSIYTGLGAQWNASRPDTVLIIVAVWQLQSYTGITEAELNIDGEKILLTPPSGSTTDFDTIKNYWVYRQSTRAFATDIAIVKKIIASKRTWLRIHTPTGYIEDAVIDGATDSKAYNALIRFIAAVEEK
ncbi:MAG: hypothetical protein NTW12_09585 [Deltaproteobacteria bacterium]|nr:hypothetical protein [Deltaproteobacteria bacterium]